MSGSHRSGMQRGWLVGLGSVCVLAVGLALMPAIEKIREAGELTH